MKVVESTSKTIIRDSILGDRFQMEEVIKTPFGAPAVMLREESLINAIEILGAKEIVAKDTMLLVQALDRAKGLDEEEGRLHWAIGVIHTLVSQGRSNELYEAISKSFPEF